ncbi:hypothetical protein F5J12DRAFT_782309 [Pisolithus orientalis]|uniref:uncharacterized protein n=1 Tax=Pisolithus orientalis TaxID=936130 RepID=UPI0022259578|nr:uncharacterized protein F5J12DRAFT_782309 [Pisolithus orientalis]KAI6008901.1 hypothetical protein F5J12DRAFT_782309 [Pisolithus orientalis]
MSLTICMLSNVPGPPLLLVQEIPPPVHPPTLPQYCVIQAQAEGFLGQNYLLGEVYPPYQRATDLAMGKSSRSCHPIQQEERSECPGKCKAPCLPAKKEINAVIAQVIFSKDLVYGAVYATQTERFASAVGSHLASLKAKYQQQASRFKSTGEGINPNNPAYSNLLEEVVTEFPFWEECNCMWHGNPAYDARLFNPAPGTNWMGNFLSIVNQGGTTVTVTPSGSTATATVTPTVTDMQVQQPTNQNNTMARGQSGGEGASINDFSMGGIEQGEDEDEEGEMSPYARSPPSVISTSTMTSAVSDGANWHQVASSETSQMKGKNMLTQLKADFNKQLVVPVNCTQDRMQSGQDPGLYVQQGDSSFGSRW